MLCKVMERRIDKFKKEKSNSEFFEDTYSNVWSKVYFYWNCINNI